MSSVFITCQTVRKFVSKWVEQLTIADGLDNLAVSEVAYMRPKHLSIEYENVQMSRCVRVYELSFSLTETL